MTVITNRSETHSRAITEPEEGEKGDGQVTEAAANPNDQGWNKPAKDKI